MKKGGEGLRLGGGGRVFGLVSVYGYGEKDCDLVGGMLEEIEVWVRREGLDGFMVFGDLNAGDG